MPETVNDTEKQIFDAAIKVFQRKGMAGARMQEIADEAGINKSMLHYYFRSKEKLFRQIFLISLKKFIGSVVPLLNEQNTWEQKVPLIIEYYAKFLTENPDLPFFVLSEIRNNAEEFLSEVKIEDILINSVFMEQLKNDMGKEKIRRINPVQIFLSIISGIIFPFIAKPMVKHVAKLDDNSWNEFINERKDIVSGMVINYLKQF
ncbi:TetR/AcrR family transcriptional regulator [Mucilaginibacter sp.]|jgi:AcrR family transcriptional regulator|uniref:TetR/AcrR family transcriptional regulator n=1 Tax=Mucilaginibacter sp. TaxID=1882438 RepID=UPI003569D20F